MSWLHRNKQLALLTALACAYFVQSIIHGSRGAQFLSGLFMALIVVAVLLVVFENRRSRFVALLLVLAVIGSNAAHYWLPAAEFETPLSTVHYGLLTVFLGYSVAVILGDIFHRSTVRTDDVLGAVNGYLIAGAAWSSVYGLIYTLAPEAFALPPAFAAHVSDWPGRLSVFNYFSVSTLTSVGYGDITPVRAPATTFAMMEAIFGQFYIAVVVAQLVGARLSNPAEGQR